MMTETRSEHVVLDELDGPIIVKTTMKVRELVAAVRLHKLLGDDGRRPVCEDSQEGARGRS